MNSINVQGMTCNHCRQGVTDAISKVAGVKSVAVDLEKGTAGWTDSDPAAPASVAAIRQAVTDIGFDVV